MVAKKRRIFVTSLCLIALVQVAWALSQLREEDSPPKPLTVQDIENCRQAARRMAEKSWRDHDAVLFRDDETAGCFSKGRINYIYSFDRRTGLGVVPRAGWAGPDDHGPGLREYHLAQIHEFAYNKRIRELIEEHGIPVWSKKEQLVPPIVLKNYLDLEGVDDSMRRQDFPIRFGKSLTIIRKGPSAVHVVIRNGMTVIAENEQTGEFRNVVKDVTWDLVGYGKGPVDVYKDAAYPQVLIVRIGNWKVIALDRNGESMGSAYREDED